MIDNKIADKITKNSKNSKQNNSEQQNNSETVTSENDKEIPKERCVYLQKKKTRKFSDELRLKSHNNEISHNNKIVRKNYASFKKFRKSYKWE